MMQNHISELYSPDDTDHAWDQTLKALQVIQREMGMIGLASSILQSKLRKRCSLQVSVSKCIFAY